MNSSHQRLNTLDAMRGIAATLVVAYHASGPSSGTIPSGFLAVDFFFVLSGLVIARTYGERLSGPLSFIAFCKIRFIRLYPLFLLGLTLELIRSVVLVSTGKLTLSFSDLGISFLRETFILPSDSSLQLLFFLNPPAWSLFQELLVNLVFGVVLYRLSNIVLTCIAAFAFTTLTISAVQVGTFDLGAEWSLAYMGFARSLFGFIVGILMARIKLPRAGESWRAVVVAAALIGILWAPASTIVQGICILIVMPTLVGFGAVFEPPRILRKAFSLIGEASYPMYALHWPLIWPLMSVTRALHLPPAAGATMVSLLLIFIGILVSRLYEIRVRNYLRHLPIEDVKLHAAKVWRYKNPLGD